MLIKKEILLHDIKKANEGNKWSFGNGILYDMCRENSEHICAEVIIGKIWLIGRSYAAAIERRKKFNESDVGDNFYCNVVAPKMLEIGPELDRRINNLKQFDCIRKEHLKEIVDTHLFLTNIFSDITV